MLPYTSIPLVLCCDQFYHRQEKHDSVDLVTVDNDGTIWHWIVHVGSKKLLEIQLQKSKILSHPQKEWKLKL